MTGTKTTPKKKEPFKVCVSVRKKNHHRALRRQCLHHVEVDSTKATREDARKPEKDVLFRTYSLAKYTNIRAALYIYMYINTEVHV